jgi:hypothetical protein
MADPAPVPGIDALNANVIAINGQPVVTFDARLAAPAAAGDRSIRIQGLKGPFDGVNFILQATAQDRQLLTIVGPPDAAGAHPLRDPLAFAAGTDALITILGQRDPGGSAPAPVDLGPVRAIQAQLAGIITQVPPGKR